MSSRRRRTLQSSNSVIGVSSDNGENSARVTDFPGSVPSVKINFADVESVIRKFTGTETISVGKWIDEFEQYANVFQWNELQKFVFCKKSLAGAAKLFVDFEAKPMTYDELKHVLLIEFRSKITSAEVHAKLRERKKKNDESLREYLYNMIDIASQANIDEASIANYVIDGIKDTASNKTILFGAKNLSELKEKLLIYEKIKKDESSKSVFEKKKNGKSRQENGEKKKSRYCFNCGSKEHEFHNCPQKEKGPKCFKCNGFGHKSPDCPLKKEKQSASAHMVVINSMCLSARVNEVLLECLIDTGSDICLLKESYIKLINPVFISRCLSLSVAGLGANVKTKGCCKVKIELSGDIYHDVDVHIVEDNCMKPSMIIGMSLLRSTIVNVDAGKVTVTKKSSQKIQEIPEKKENEEKEEASCFLTDIKVETELTLSELTGLENLKEENINKIVELIENYSPDLSTTSPIQMKIVPIDEKPVFQSPRRFPMQEQKIIDQQVEDWLKSGIIRESTSDYASPVVLVKKKDGSHRLCVDFRALNKRIQKDHFPLPVIEDQIDKLQGATIFTTLDLENGFFHVPIEEDSRKFTSFVTQKGQFEFLKVPFGLCNSPSVFQRFINFTFRDLVNKGIVIIYIDDLIIPASSEKEAIARLELVLKVAAKGGLRIKWKKCQFLQKEVEYLGHVIKSGSVSPSPAKIKAVIKFPEPKTTKQLHSFLGLTSYFRKFIPGYSEIAKSLSDLLKKNARFKFGADERDAFEKLKQMLTSPPVLKIFNHEDYTELHTDASKHGIAAVLLQRGSTNETLRPVYYMSRKTTEAQQKWNSYELEVLAVVEAVKKFRVYLLGKKFKLVTDCKAFTMTLNKKDLATRIARWSLLLEDFEYEVEHRAGSKMRHVDALSRNVTSLCVRVDDNIRERLKIAQSKDEKICAIVEALKHGPYRDYVLHCDILCKEVGEKLLYVVPEGMKNTIIRMIHEDGHFHYKKMKEKIEKEFYISDLKKRIETCLANCVKCILSEKKKGKAESTLHPIPKGETPFETFHIDHLGPLTTTKKGYRYIFAVIDAFTKFCWLFPTRTLNAEEAVKKIESIADTFGYPGRIISDRGGAFISNYFRNYCKDHNIKLYFITSGVPRGNGQVERLHTTVIAVLTKMSLQNPEKWYQNVAPLQRTLNNMHHRAIQMTPFKLLVGIEMRTEKEAKIIEMLEEECLQQFEEERNELRRRAKEAISQIQEENRRTYDKRKKKAPKYAVGDLVAIERTQLGVGLKIKPKFLGPYKVTTIKGFDRYEVVKVGQGEGPTATSVSADKMKKWVNDTLEEDDWCEQDEAEEEEEENEASRKIDGDDDNYEEKSEREDEGHM